MNKHSRAFATASALSVFLLGCGGGSGTPTPSPTPVSTAPNFTSPISAQVAENTAAAFYTATAVDPQGDPIAFSIQSGADADRFVIDSNGALRFDIAPNFDLPVDTNGDNIYLVNILASAGGETDVLNLRVAVTNDKEGIVVTRVASGIVDPVDFSFVHNEPTLLIAEASGRVLAFDPDSGTLSENTFIRDRKLPGEVLAIAFAFPDRRFQEGIYLVTHDAADGLYLQAFNEEFDATGFARLGGPWQSPVTASLQPQNELYLAIGDPGGTRAQNSSSPYGKLYQFGRFSPFASASLPQDSSRVILPEIIGDGIQMPGGFSPAADFLYLADQGSSVEHELTIFRRSSRPLDFGWPFYEGSQAVRNDPPAQVNGPTLAYAVGDQPRQGTGIIAGLLNDGNFFPEIGDSYIFGDTNGQIFQVPRTLLIDGFLHFSDEFEVRSEDFAPDVGSIDNPIAFTMGFGTSHFYILDGDGEIFRVAGSQ